MKKIILIAFSLLLLSGFSYADNFCSTIAYSLIRASDGTYLGGLSSNSKDPESIANPTGLYGSKYQVDSIFNQYQLYGSRYQMTSPRNKYSLDAPYLYKGNGYRRLSINPYIEAGLNTFDVVLCFISPFDERLIPYLDLDEGNRIKYKQEESCQYQFGSYATVAEERGQCKCKDGYTWDLGMTKCVADDNALCKIEFGVFAISGGPGQCKCMDGYQWNTNRTSCIKEKTQDEICQEQYGIYSYSPEPGYCNCKDGYEWGFGKTTCIKSATTNNTTNNNNGGTTNGNNGFGSTNNNSNTNTETSKNRKVINYYTNKNDELKDAIQWMYDNGLTRYNNVNDFLPYNEITREQASKFFVEFAAKELGKARGSVESYDIFFDLKDADPTLKDHIIYANNMGMFKGSNGMFMPFNKLTKAQAVAVAIRMVDGYLDESASKPFNLNDGTGFSWYSEYVSRAIYSYKLNKWGTFDNFESLDTETITRGQLALLLYEMHLYREVKCFFGESHFNGGDMECERLGTGWNFLSDY